MPLLKGREPVGIRRADRSIEIARSSPYVDEYRGAPKKILIIDDAIGSGGQLQGV